MNKLIIGVLSLLALNSCKTDSEQAHNMVDQEYGIIPYELRDSLKLVSEASQVFQIDPAKSNTIVGDRGTTIIIPQNILVNQDGSALSGLVSLELKENFEVIDYVLSNLQTVHNDMILESSGMIYFKAVDENGKELKITDSHSIRVEIPQDKLFKDAKIFLGQRDESGLINWDVIHEPAKTLVPYPIEFISKNRFPTECSNNFGITKDTIENRRYTYYGKLSDYENSLLATKEFAERYQSTCWKEVISIYISNLDKNLWEIDELVVKHFINDSIVRVKGELNSVYPNPLGGERTKAQKEAHNWFVNKAKVDGHRLIELYKSFANQKLTKVDQTKLIDTTKVKSFNESLVSYDAMKFGWINVDFFYNDPKAVPIKLIARTNIQAPIISLVLKDRNVILSGIENSPNEYWFTKTQEGYNKLPKGEKAVIFAIGYDGTHIMFGQKEIMIGENEVENVNLALITGEALKNELKKYGS